MPHEIAKLDYDDFVFDCAVWEISRIEFEYQVKSQRITDNAQAAFLLKEIEGL